MTEDEARAILKKAYGKRKDAKNQCFGDCCLRSHEKEALITVIYGQKGKGKR